MTTLFNKLASGSSGNAIIYHNEILVDLGVAYKTIKPFLDTIKYLLLTHRHGDHYNISAILRLATNYPDIVIIGNSDVINDLEEYGVENTYVINSNEWYELGDYTIATVETVHDKPNVAYRIIKPLFENDKYIKDYKLFHATDLRDLFDVEAIGYDAYFIEFNHDENIIAENIAKKRAKNVFAYENNAKQFHQSNQRAYKWLKKNNTANGLIVPLHISKKNNKEEYVENYIREIQLLCK